MEESVRTNIRTYRDSFQGIGCGAGCMVHVVLICFLGLAVLVWCIKNRAWELSVTVEMPAEKKAVPEAEKPDP
ncbi:hypothetical protein [Prosthecobacter sp.]|uniref:hypothetical protein n=1 Tax=Prosthecobacter sp. TaxID=1965333 RepID=UPI002489D8F0|nr:hypothetical protein [Prosthecobacter sp.]MDI1313376.1 hypothetical protein [Prosthecobacter sp.]